VREMLKDIKRINHLISISFERVGIVAVLFMIGVTCVDAFGIKVLRSPITGAIDIVMLSQVVGIAFAIASTQILGKHVRVDFFIDRLPASMQAMVDSVVYFLLFIFSCLVVWRLYVLGHSFEIAREVTATLYVPLYLFVYGAALACIPVCLVFLIEFLSSLVGAVRR
jgi:TRAP-type C4-dicarboxylate transport system permease small subunit